VEVDVRRIITISARYGAGGSVVGPDVADALGFPFFDRAVPQAGVPGVDGEGAPLDERTGGLWVRVLEAFAQMPADPSSGMLTVGNDAALRSSAEEQLRQFAAGEQGVVLGWASAVVIADGYHVRLDGPPDARLHQAMAIDGGLTEAEARRQLKDTDRIRSLYWRRLYGREFTDMDPYHLVVDSTAVDLPTVTHLITTGARAFWSR
jgi:cytidylate kinase